MAALEEVAVGRVRVQGRALGNQLVDQCPVGGLWIL
jgi:hypothetical protein